MQRKQQEERQQKHLERQQFVARTMKNVDTVLEAFQEKISSVEHHSEDAHNIAVKLLEDLKSAQLEYRNKLNQPEANISNANAAFKERCAVLIADAKPVLERDLGWGDYLANLFKAIGNAIILCVTFGQVHSFFKYARSESVEVAEEMERNLQQSGL